MQEWKEITIDKLGLPQNVLKSLEAAELTTIAQIESFGDLTQVDGIGVPSAKMVANAIAVIAKDLDGTDPADDSTPRPPTRTDDEVSGDDSDNETPPVELTDMSDHEQDLLLHEQEELIRREFVAKQVEKAETVDDDRLYAMLAEATRANDYELVQRFNLEIDARFENQRNKQTLVQVPVRFSGLNRRGNNSAGNISTHIHRQRVSRTAAVALAKLHLAMIESGEKLANGRKVSKRADVVNRLLELTYESMNNAEKGGK